MSEKQQEENQEAAAGKGTIASIVKKLVKQGKDKGFLPMTKLTKRCQPMNMRLIR